MAARTDIAESAPPCPLDLSHRFSRSSKKRVVNVLKDYYRFLSLPGMGSLAGGLPYHGYFPFTQLNVSTALPHNLSGVSQNPSQTQDDALNLCIRQTQHNNDIFRKIDLATALQYSLGQGFPPLYAWIRKWTSSVYHFDIPYQGKADVVICGGSADGLAKIYDLLFNEWDPAINHLQDREGLLVEEMVYSPPVAQTKHKDVNIVPVRMDAEGMKVDGPGGLLDVLENWNEVDGKRPHVLYVIPTGQNPTSGVLSLSRRRRIYEICSSFDVMIIEDDPYWNLLYPNIQTHSAPINKMAEAVQKHETANGTRRSTGYSFLDQLVPSFLSLDIDGRVIRLDTFSKTIAPGCRLGWITAQPKICEQFIRLTDASTQSPCGMIQAVVAQLLSDFDDSSELDSPSSTDDAMPKKTKESWRMSGWVRWLESLRDNYQRRMITMATVFQQGRHLQTPSGGQQIEMFSFNWPMGGMFIWIKVNIEQHPLNGVVDSKRLMHALWILCTQEPYRVLTNPGRDFAANDNVRCDRAAHTYLRFCFAAVEENVLVSKSHAFVDACHRFWNVTDRDGIDRILKDENERVIGASSSLVKNKSNTNRDEDAEVEMAVEVDEEEPDRLILPDQF